MPYSTTVTDKLHSIAAQQWNALDDSGNPFLRHEFLDALEQNDCLGPRWGWLPQHILVHDDNKRLVGAMPMYIKDNSYGELVFDWAWAQAYQQHGLAYYPKLVAAIPYTPVTGPRLLCAAGNEQDTIKSGIARAALDHARQLDVSSLHILFPDEHDTRILEQHGMMKRVGVQFHWHNNDYHSFDDFLAALASKKRKQIRQERRRVRDAWIEIELLSGHDTTDRHWQIFHDFYCSTFYRKSGHPTLSLAFFIELAQRMPDEVLLIMAKHNNEYVAGAFNLRGRDTLYGRHWGCSAHFDKLHFEVCYYAAIEYCIEVGLQRFEAGAQGEHKLSRGFLPVPTWSAHWIAHEGFRDAIADFVEREQHGMEHYTEVLGEHSPFRQGGN
ncbi:MAG: GNAT family N-acetyltransferase [Granulosicoccaceae bacterium]|jgi:hypothetical protein